MCLIFCNNYVHDARWELWFQGRPRETPVFARVGEGCLHFFGGRELFAELELMNFKSQRTNLSIATKACAFIIEVLYGQI